MPEQPVYDLEAVLDEQVKPLVDQIYAICEAHGIPFVASFCYASDGTKGLDVCTTCLPRGNWQPVQYKAFVLAMVGRREY